jgi:alanine-synthesizing transaminase
MDAVRLAGQLSFGMCFSSRLPTSMEPNGLARRLARRKALGLDVLDLTLSNPTCCGFRYPAEAIRSALGRPVVMTYDPDPKGSAAARETIAAFWGHGLSGQDLILSASTSETYSWLFKLLGEPGDDVLVPSPSYPLFEWLARMEGLETRLVPAFRFDGWQLDLEGLDAACGPRTRAVVVVNPNNPTGHFLTRGEWDRLVSFCSRKALVLVVDEVFSAYPLEPSADAILSALEDHLPACTTVVLSGLSKSALLPQMKLAWAAVRGPDALRLLEGLEFIADQYLSVSAPVLAALPDLLGMAPDLQNQALDRLRGNLSTLDRLLDKAPAWSRLRVGGGWSVVLRRPALSSDEAFTETLLSDQGVLVHPGNFFGFPPEGYLVLSLLAEPSILEKGMLRVLGMDPGL